MLKKVNLSILVIAFCLSGVISTIANELERQEFSRPDVYFGPGAGHWVFKDGLMTAYTIRKYDLGNYVVIPCFLREGESKVNFNSHAISKETLAEGLKLVAEQKIYFGFVNLAHPRFNPVTNREAYAQKGVKGVYCASPEDINEIISKLDYKPEVFKFQINLFDFGKKEPTVIIDVSKEFPLKMKALSCFKSQILSIYLLEPLILLKGIIYGRRHGFKYAEYFYGE